VAALVAIVIFPFLVLPDRSKQWNTFLSVVAGAVPEIQRERFVDQVIKELLKARIPSKKLQVFTYCFIAHWC